MLFFRHYVRHRICLNFSLITNGLQEGSTPPSFLIYHAPLLKGVTHVSTEILFFPLLFKKKKRGGGGADDLTAH